MRNGAYLFSSESVSEGHPDKLCDHISDRVVDLCYREAQSNSWDAHDVRVACETLATTNRVVIAGEFRAPKSVDKAHIEEVARKVIRETGYEQDGFHWRNAKVEVLLHEQSVDIAQGVDATRNSEEGAGDQGIMFGYACRETDCLMPAPVFYSHRVLERLAKKRHEDPSLKLGPDSKCQLTVHYRDGKPLGIHQIVISHQHLDENMSPEMVREIIEPECIAALPQGWITKDTIWHVNPTGKFFIGGPDGDAGLTGRKIIVDTYGGAAPHGGGAFSGKDPTKVDRSAAYACRYLAKNIVAAELASRCTIQVAYAIGVSDPLSVFVDLHHTGNVEETKLEANLRDVMDLTPRGLRDHLKLDNPIYKPSATYGHFGRDPRADGCFSWEKLDLVETLKSMF